MDHSKKLYRRHLNPQYVSYLEKNGLDKHIVHASGSRLRVADGKEFIDLVAGYGVHNFGHNPPQVVRAIVEVLDGKNLLSRPFLNPDLAEAASALCFLVGKEDGRAFFCSTGAETVDTAIKLARLSTGRKKIVSAQQSFHGFTIGALSVSGIRSQRMPFEPLMPGVGWVPYGDIEALCTAIDADTAAVILEPVQAETGAIAPPPAYLSEAKKLASDAGALLICDEVRTGFGRTGTLFGYEHDDVSPDMVLLGKSLGSGIVPVAAVVSDGSLHARADMSFAMSASSFAGNRLATVAARATLELASDPEILHRSVQNGELAWDRLNLLADLYPNVVEKITGKGLLIGLHFRNIKYAQAVVTETIDRGVLTGLAFCNSKCILLEPPINIGATVFETALDTLIGVIKDCESNDLR